MAGVHYHLCSVGDCYAHLSSSKHTLRAMENLTKGEKF